MKKQPDLSQNPDELRRKAEQQLTPRCCLMILENRMSQALSRADIRTLLQISLKPF
jgi:hypothetical protein